MRNRFGSGASDGSDSFRNFLAFVGAASAGRSAANGLALHDVRLPFSQQDASRFVARLRPRGMRHADRVVVVEEVMRVLAPPPTRGGGGGDHGGGGGGVVSQASFEHFVYGKKMKKQQQQRQQRRQRHTKHRDDSDGGSIQKSVAFSTAELFALLRQRTLQTSSSLRLFAGFKTYGHGDGASIDFSSFRDGLQNKHSLRAAPGLVRELFDVLDLNGNGRIELDEFVRTMVRAYHPPTRWERSTKFGCGSVVVAVVCGSCPCLPSSAVGVHQLCPRSLLRARATTTPRINLRCSRRLTRQPLPTSTSSTWCGPASQHQATRSSSPAWT